MHFHLLHHSCDPIQLFYRRLKIELMCAVRRGLLKNLRCVMDKFQIILTTEEKTTATYLFNFIFFVGFQEVNKSNYTILAYLYTLHAHTHTACNARKCFLCLLTQNILRMYKMCMEVEKYS